MRKRYVAGNWKMNTGIAEAEKLAKEIVAKSGSADAKIMIAPPFTALDKIAPIVKGTNVALGAQNCCEEKAGAFTGEISIDMLKEIGVQVIILGHSERRIIFGEKNVQINKKVLLALNSGLEVILCLGETLEEREEGIVADVVDKQLVGGLAGVSADQLKKLTIAYEPVWAIGTGKTATAADANDVHALIRNRIQDLYGETAASELLIQYGGSVKPGNAAELLSEEHIDGALVGGASLEADSFLSIINA